MVILYLLFPRAGGPFWNLPSDAYQGLTGISDTMRPGGVSDLSASYEVAFRVDFLDGVTPAARDLYWRGIVLWNTNGQSWTRATPPVALARPESPANAVRYRLTLEPSNKRWLFALDVPVTAADNAIERPGFTFESIEPILKRTSYTMTSVSRYTTGPLTNLELRAALQLPPQSPRLRTFANELREQYPDPQARALALLRHIRQENFVYTLSPPLLGKDPVDEFFFDVRRGFCEHYAAAFATIMRATRVPARVVMGYQGGELNPNGNYLIVRQSDAHAWVEIWLEGRGWTRVDPTAAIAPERIELGIEAIRRLEQQGLRPGMGSDLLARALELPWLERTARQLRLFWDYTNIAWYRWVIDYKRENQEGLLYRLGFETIDWTRILWLLGGAFAAVMLAYVAWSRRGTPLDPAQRAYLRFCRKLARIGVRRATHEGALDFAARAQRTRPDLAGEIDAITEKYLHVRYGRRASNDDLRALAEAVARFRARRRSNER
jgi:transglutaminase-like putative cysteine protease